MTSVLVLDSGAFITGAKLDRFGPDVHYVTVPDVFDEITSEASRRTLETFPFKIHTRHVTVEAVRAVSHFAKKTGDLTYLSGPDIKILALAYMYEKEKHGDKHLRSEPPAKSVSRRAAPREVTDATPFTEVVDVIPFDVDEFLFLGPAAFRETHQLGAMQEDVVAGEDEGEEDMDAEVLPEGVTGGAGATGDPFWGTDPDGSWITKDNIALQTQNKTAAADDKNLSTVACVTTDYAMQNVMMTMGLRLLAVNGLEIKNIRTAMKRCHACLAVERNMDKTFCLACGNCTLLKVTMSTSTSGMPRYYMSRKQMFNKRGTVYSIPKMRGGRNNKDLKLREADPSALTNEVFYSKKKEGDFNDILEFGMGKVGKTKVYQHKDDEFGYGRRNPNASTPGKRDKNKRNHRRK
jgi:RNA-binding protein NOB1